VGTVFQGMGVAFFAIGMLVCCMGSLFGSDAIRHDLSGNGWRLPGDPPHKPTYNVPVAMAASVAMVCLLGIALAGAGLGLQAQKRSAPWWAVAATFLGMAFWIMQSVFAATILRSILWALAGGTMAVCFALLLGLALAALRQMRADPPPAGYQTIPPDELAQIEQKIRSRHSHNPP